MSLKNSLYSIVLFSIMLCYYWVTASNKQPLHNCISREHIHHVFNDIDVFELIKYNQTSTFSSAKTNYLIPQNHKVYVEYSLDYNMGYDCCDFKIDSLQAKGISEKDILTSSAVGNLKVSYTGNKKSFDIRDDDKEQELIFFSIVNPWVEFIKGIRIGLSKKKLIQNLGACFVQRGDSLIAYHDGEHTLVKFFLLNDTINQIEYGKYNYIFSNDSIPEEYLKRNNVFWYSYKKYRIYPNTNQK